MYIYGMFLARKISMDRICQHCGESFVGNAYRVTSEEQGITLLDMIVCSLCFMEAKRLRLRTEEINLSGKQAPARTDGTTARDPKFSFKQTSRRSSV
jgi:hypothetical protein